RTASARRPPAGTPRWPDGPRPAPRRWACLPRRRCSAPAPPREPGVPPRCPRAPRAASRRSAAAAVPVRRRPPPGPAPPARQRPAPPGGSTARPRGLGPPPGARPAPRRRRSTTVRPPWGGRTPAPPRSPGDSPAGTLARSGIERPATLWQACRPRMPDTQPLTFRRRATVLVLLWAALAMVPIVFPAAIVPFAGSALIAYLVAPLLDWLTGQRAFGRVIPRWVAILFIYAVFFLLTYLFII